MKGLAAVILLVAAFLPALPARPAGAEDFGPTVTLPDSAHPEWGTADHKLDDDGTTMTVTGYYTLSGNNTFTGGTEIASGTLNITDSYSYNQATAGDGSRTGYIMFTGAEQPGKRKYVTLLGDAIQPNPVFHNSFRTANGSGTENYVDLTAFGSRSPVAIRENTLKSDQGGAFYVNENTGMNVSASRLVLGGDNHDGDLFNKTDTNNNDLYIGQDAEFNLNVDEYVMFNSGIDGETTSSGVLNLKPLMSSALSYAHVYLVNNTSSDGAQTFHTGTTNVQGSAGKALFSTWRGANSGRQ